MLPGHASAKNILHSPISNQSISQSHFYHLHSYHSGLRHRHVSPEICNDLFTCVFPLGPLLFTLHLSQQGDLLKQKVGDHVIPLIKILSGCPAHAVRVKVLTMAHKILRNSFRLPSRAMPVSPFQCCFPLPF